MKTSTKTVLVKSVVALVVCAILVGCILFLKGGQTGEKYIGESKGFGGPVTVELTVSDGKIILAKVTGDQETPEIGGAALDELAAQIMAAQSADIDGVAGATMTSNGARKAAAIAIALSKGEEPPAEPTPTPLPSAAPAAAGTYTPGTYSASAEGFGGDVTVEITTTDSEITDVKITGNDETPNIGGAAIPDLEAQIKAYQSADIDGVSGATFTSDAVKQAAAAAIAEAKGEDAPPAPVESEEPIPSGEPGTFTPGTYTGTGTGFGGDVTVEITTDDANILDVKVTGPDETPEIGGRALDKLADQIKRAQSADIDGISGATFTSDGAKRGALVAIAAAKGEEAPPEPTEPPEETPAPAPSAAPGTYTAGTYSASSKGFGGDVTVKITTTDNSITDVQVTGAGETPSIGGRALDKLASQIKSAQSANIDGVSGATLTSNAAKKAAAAAIAKAKGESVPVEPTPTPTPSAPPAPPAPAGTYTPGTYSGSSRGFGGDVTVQITTTDTQITDVKITGASETPAIGGAALDELADQIKAAQSDSIDGVSGATLTSNAAKKAAKAAIDAAKGQSAPPASQPPASQPPASQPPASEPPAASGGKYKPGTYTGTGTGFGGDVVVTITTDDNAITSVSITGDRETPAIGGAALEELADQIKAAQSANIDGVSGATFTSDGVKDAIKDALAKAMN